MKQLEGVVDEDSFIRTGFWLFLDIVILSVGGWLFWLVISALTTPEEIGYATTLISLVTLVSGVFGLGLDYSVLREIGFGGARVFGTALLFEILLLSLLSPLIIFIFTSIYSGISMIFLGLAAGLLLFVGTSFITKYSALALLKSSHVLLYDSVSSIARFGVGVWLVLAGFGAVGIVGAGLVQQVLATVALTAVCIRSLGFKLGGLSELKTLLQLGISNVPSRMAQITITSLAVVLLGAFTSDPSIVGIFYVALMISLVAGGLGASIATMTIPISSRSGRDDAMTSLRIGLSLTTPVAAGLAAAPGFILSLIGESYISADIALTVLAISIIPSIVVWNGIAKLNSRRMLRNLILLGSIQLIFFIIPFIILVPSLKGLAAAIAVLSSSLTASIPSSFWLGRRTLRHSGIAYLSLIIGWLIGSHLFYVIQPLGFLGAALVSFTVILLLRETSIREVLNFVRMILHR